MAEKLTKKEKEFERLKAAFFEDPNTDPVKGTTVRYGMKPYQALVTLYGDPYEHKPRETKTPGKKTSPKTKKDSEEEPPKKKSKKDKSDEDEETLKKKKSKKDKSEEDEETPKKKKSKKDKSKEDDEAPKKKDQSEDEEETPKKKSKKDKSDEEPPKKKSKKDSEDTSKEKSENHEYIKLRKILKSSKIESFYVKEVECHDLLFTFEITLTTDKGQFEASVCINDKLLENMTILFRPEFGDMLRRRLLKQLKQDIESEELMSNLVYTKY